MSILAPGTRATQVDNSCACGGSFNQYRDGGKVILKCTHCGRLAPQKITDEMKKRAEDAKNQAGTEWWNASGKPPSKLLEPPQTPPEGEESQKEPESQSGEDRPADETQGSPAGVKTGKRKLKQDSE